MDFNTYCHQRITKKKPCYVICSAFRTGFIGYGWSQGCWCPDSRWCSAAPPVGLVSEISPPERQPGTNETDWRFLALHPLPRCMELRIKFEEAKTRWLSPLCLTPITKRSYLLTFFSSLFPSEKNRQPIYVCHYSTDHLLHSLIILQAKIKNSETRVIWKCTKLSRIKFFLKRMIF